MKYFNNFNEALFSRKKIEETESYTNRGSFDLTIIKYNAESIGKVSDLLRTKKSLNICILISSLGEYATMIATVHQDFNTFNFIQTGYRTLNGERYYAYKATVEQHGTDLSKYITDVEHQLSNVSDIVKVSIISQKEQIRIGINFTDQDFDIIADAITQLKISIKGLRRKYRGSNPEFTKNRNNNEFYCIFNIYGLKSK